MTDPDIAYTLQQLEQAVGKLQELDQWAKLAQQEHWRGTPLDQRLDQHLAQEIQDAFSLYCTLDSTLRDILNRADSPTMISENGTWRDRLLQLERRAQKLQLRERFINR